MNLYINHIDGVYAITPEGREAIEKVSPVSASTAIKGLKAEGYTRLVIDDIAEPALAELEYWGI